LDLNASDATTGAQGLALPRVNLTSNTMLLPGVTTNLPGMMVYNATATIGSVGVYVWTGSSWTQASFPTAAADGQILIYHPATGWTSQTLVSSYIGTTTSPMTVNSTYNFSTPGTHDNSVCVQWSSVYTEIAEIHVGYVVLRSLANIDAGFPWRINCVNW